MGGCCIDSRRLFVGLLVVSLLTLRCFWGEPVAACPFCSALAPTISDDLESASASVLTTCESVREDKDGFYVYQMRVAQVIKGRPELGKSVIEVVSIEQLPSSELFWHIGYGEDSIEWVVPKPMSLEATAYLHGLLGLPDPGPERLGYFLRYLRHADDVVATDAYNEFADATLEEVAALSDQLDRAWVIRQLRSATVPVHRRRLCWTFLSQCGQQRDADLFDELLGKRADDPAFDPGLDAAIGCFMSLAGETALDRIEHDFLGNPDASYVDTYAAVSAIRVHGTELDVFPRPRLAAALRRVLERPAIADLVIPDLARWEDWSVVHRVSELFAKATEETHFVRSSVVMYLKTCPLPEAATSLEELRKLAPETVRDAEASMRFYGGVASVPVPLPADEASSKPKAERKWTR
ncbi:MAG: hypothetical protein AAGD07_14315 [Planctomycetota bacterium]